MYRVINDGKINYYLILHRKSAGIDHALLLLLLRNLDPSIQLGTAMSKTNAHVG
jgi:hypothetical protein